MKYFCIPMLTIVLGLLTATSCYADVSYEVVKGDTLRKIAEKYKLDYQELGKYNQILNFNRIYVGQNLLIPIEEENPKEKEKTEAVNKPKSEEKKIVKPESAEFVKYINSLSDWAPIAPNNLVSTLKKMKLKNVDAMKVKDEKDISNYFAQIEGKQQDTIYLCAKIGSQTDSISFQAEEAVAIMKALQDVSYTPNKTISLFLYQENAVDELSVKIPDWQENCFAILDINSFSKSETGYHVKVSCDLNNLAEDLVELSKNWNHTIIIDTTTMDGNSVSYLKLGVPAAAQWVSDPLEEELNSPLDKSDSIFLKKAMGKFLFDLDSMAVKPLNLSARMKISVYLKSDSQKKSSNLAEVEKLNNQIQSMNNVTMAALAEGDIQRVEKILAQASEINKLSFEMNFHTWDGIE